MQIGEIYMNKINGSTAEVIEIRGNIITFECKENRTNSFLNETKEPEPETVIRHGVIDFLNKYYIKPGIIKYVSMRI